VATLKVTIAGKEFPLTVDESTHQQVLEATDMINQKIEEHQQQYQVDVKDALAMCALELATINSQLQLQASEWNQAQKELDTLRFTLRHVDSL